MDHARQRTDRELAPDRQPWIELLPCPSVHSDFSPLASLPAPDENCAAGSVEVALLKRERFADPQSGAPEQDDQRAEPVTVGAVTDRAHDRHDLLDRRRVGGIALALVSRRAALVVARHCRGRAGMTGEVQLHDSMNSPWWDRLTIRLLESRARTAWNSYQLALCALPRVRAKQAARRSSAWAP